MQRGETGRSWLRAPWVIFWVAFGLRVAVILIGRTYKVRIDQANFNFGFETGRIARSVATGHGYANPFNGVSGPTAWLPPLYPLLVAGVFRIFGVYTRWSAFVILTLNSLFSAAVVPAVYEIAARVFDAKGIGRRGAKGAAPVALWSAWLWAVYPAALQYAIHWVWEMSLTVMLFTWVIVVALRLRERAGNRKRQAGDSELAGLEEQILTVKAPFLRGATMAEETPGISPGLPVSGHLNGDLLRLWGWFGLVWGLIALSNASVLLCFPAMMVWIAWPELPSKGSRFKVEGSRSDVRGLMRHLIGACLACAVFGVVLAPWVVRNERVLHGFVPTRGNLGIELFNSSLPMYDGYPWGTAMSLWPGDPVFQQYVRMGEVKFAAMRQRQALANLRGEPALFVRWTVQRFFFFWDGTPHAREGHPVREYLRQLSYSFISACGLLGLVLVLRRRVEGAGLFALCFALVPVPYYLVTAQPRFRHPLEPLIAVLAVYLFRSAEKIRSRP